MPYFDKGCGIQKYCWLEDNYMLENVGITWALLVLYIIMFWK